MEAGHDDSPTVLRRFNPFRTFTRGFKAACRWTVGLGRGRGLGARARRRGRRGGPPLASLSAAMLEPEELLELGENTAYSGRSGRAYLDPASVAASAWDSTQHLTQATSSGGSVFPLVLKRPFHVAHATPGAHQHPLVLSYHANADDYPLQHHHLHHQLHADGDDGDWLHYHNQPSRYTNRSSCLCTCGGAAIGGTCEGACPASAGTSATAASSDSLLNRHHNHHEVGHSLQHLLAVGSRQWGGGGWWDGRALLKVKIYDFAVYADTAKAAQALRNATSGSDLPCGTAAPLGNPNPGVRHLHSTAARMDTPFADRPGGGVASTAVTSPAVYSAAAAAELLVPSRSGVDASLTIRACRNLPLSMLSQEFERILQRRHVKAGGRSDDPALQELLSYFTRERLPPHVVTAAGLPGAGGEGGADAVRKGAAITFSRSSSGELVTEAGGHVLGRVRSPALAEALFDLYLGDQPVSKRAKVAAGAALLRLSDDNNNNNNVQQGSGRLPYRYQLQPGERLLCPPGTSGGRGHPGGDVNGCLLELP